MNPHRNKHIPAFQEKFVKLIFTFTCHCLNFTGSETYGQHHNNNNEACGEMYILMFTSILAIAKSIVSLLQTKTSQQLLLRYCSHIYVSQRMDPTIFLDLLIFKCHREVGICGFVRNITTAFEWIAMKCSKDIQMGTDACHVLTLRHYKWTVACPCQNKRTNYNVCLHTI